MPATSGSDDQVLAENLSRLVLGGCQGEDSMYVKLISSDDHEFIIKREDALASGTIKVSSDCSVIILSSDWSVKVILSSDWLISSRPCYLDLERPGRRQTPTRQG